MDDFNFRISAKMLKWVGLFKRLTLLSTILFLTLLTGTANTPATAHAGNLTVCNRGCDFISIQDAVDAASPSDMITIGGTTFFENVVINKDLTIRGRGKDKTIVDGGNSNIVFRIEPGNTVELSKMTIQNGIAVDGAGIHNQGNLTVNDSIITSNTAFRDGGGIFNKGNLTATYSTISFNTSSNNGGGIFTNSLCTLISSIINDNTGYIGGGIHNINGDVDITNNIVINNTGTYRGGGLFSLNGNVNVNTTKFSDNNASSSTGGGILAESSVVLIENSTIHRNSSSGGGGIYNFRSDMTIIYSSVIDNSSSRDGGGILNYPGNSKLVLFESTLNGNSAEEGGAISNLGEVIIRNSTISNNSASSNGGGIYNFGSSPSFVLSNSTMSHNEADIGGGIHNFTGTVALKNTLVADNSATSGGSDCIGDMQSLGYNLIGDTSICVVLGDTTGNLTNINSLIGPLQDNGGPTETHALLAGSPAIDHIPTSNCTDADSNPITTDQRGEIRPQGTNCDIGAFEVTTVSQTGADLSVTKSDSPDPIQTGNTLTYTIEVSNNGPQTSRRTNLTDRLPANATFISASSTQGACNNSGRRVNCNLGKIRVGEVVTVTMEVMPTASGNLVNIAKVHGDMTDPDESNNTAKQSTQVQ